MLTDLSRLPERQQVSSLTPDDRYRNLNILARAGKHVIIGVSWFEPRREIFYAPLSDPIWTPRGTLSQKQTAGDQSVQPFLATALETFNSVHGNLQGLKAIVYAENGQTKISLVRRSR